MKYLRDSGVFRISFLALAAGSIGRMNDGGVADPVLHVLRFIHPLDAVGGGGGGGGGVVAFVVVVGQRVGRALVAPGADLAEAAGVVQQCRRLQRHRFLVRRRVDRLIRTLGDRLVDVLLHLQFVEKSINFNAID